MTVNTVKHSAMTWQQFSTQEPKRTIKRYAQIGKTSINGTKLGMHPKIRYMHAPKSTHQTTPPIEPEMVLFGLIFGQSFFPPIKLPVSIAKVSVSIGIKNAVTRTKTLTFEFMFSSLAKGKTFKWFKTTKNINKNANKKLNKNCKQKNSFTSFSF